MSSTTTTTTTTTTTRRSMERRTYWCHDCDMSISLIPPTSPSDIFTCPHCTSDFLEELDSPITFSNHSHDVYFHNIINQLFNSNLPTIPVPTPTASIESIVTLKVTCEMMEMDKDGMCAVCKEVFLVGDELKVLPCKHLYHGECILPWLSLRNSCPVCRFQLPVEPCGDGEMKARRRSRSRVFRFADFMDHDIDDEEGQGQEQELFGFGLRNFARRHRFVFPMRRSQFRTDVEGDGEEEGVFSPTQIGEEGGVSGRTDSVETVSSWPNWPVDIDVVENTDVHDVGMSS